MPKHKPRKGMSTSRKAIAAAVGATLLGTGLVVHHVSEKTTQAIKKERNNLQRQHANLRKRATARNEKMQLTEKQRNNLQTQFIHLQQQHDTHLASQLDLQHRLRMTENERDVVKRSLAEGRSQVEGRQARITQMAREIRNLQTRMRVGKMTNHIHHDLDDYINEKLGGPQDASDYRRLAPDWLKQALQRACSTPGQLAVVVSTLLFGWKITGIFDFAWYHKLLVTLTASELLRRASQLPDVQQGIARELVKWAVRLAIAWVGYSVLAGAVKRGLHHLRRNDSRNTVSQQAERNLTSAIRATDEIKKVLESSTNSLSPTNPQLPDTAQVQVTESVIGRGVPAVARVIQEMVPMQVPFNVLNDLQGRYPMFPKGREGLLEDLTTCRAFTAWLTLQWDQPGRSLSERNARLLTDLQNNCFGHTLRSKEQQLAATQNITAKLQQIVADTEPLLSQAPLLSKQIDLWSRIKAVLTGRDAAHVQHEANTHARLVDRQRRESDALWLQQLQEKWNRRAILSGQPNPPFFAQTRRGIV